MQIAKAKGAVVAVTSSSSKKLERARNSGADFTVNYRDTPAWGRKVPGWTGGSGVDHVVEVGGPATLAQSIGAVRIGGHISLVGVLTGRGGQVPTAALMAKQELLQGLIVDQPARAAGLRRRTGGHRDRGGGGSPFPARPASRRLRIAEGRRPLR